MHKRYVVGMLSGLFLLSVNQAAATPLIGTGYIIDLGVSKPYTFVSTYFAGRINLGSDVIVNDILFYGRQPYGTSRYATISVYTDVINTATNDGTTRPGDRLFTQRFFTTDQRTGWYGLRALDLPMEAGSYWLSLELYSPDNAFIDISRYKASKPLEQEGKLSLSGVSLAFLPFDLDIPWQVNGEIQAPQLPVPEPATMLMLGTGLIGLSGFTKRRLGTAA